MNIEAEFPILCPTDSWVELENRIYDWLDSLPNDAWYYKGPNVLVFKNNEDAITYKLKFGL